MKYETKRKKIHGKAQIDVPPNYYNWKSNLINSTHKNWVQKIGLNK